MEHHKEQEAGRHRMRILFQQRELDRGSLQHKRIFKTAEEEAKQARRFTPNAQARSQRELTASRGQPPVFDENIWSGERRRPAPNEIRSVSPRTRVDKDGGRAAGSDAGGDGKKGTASGDQARTASGASHNGDKNPHNSGSTDKKMSS
ncbi:hypothetical protein AYO21_01104 [Fonsecaea monophora]|uniref:Uncharacterized protein n=1 Tax=Fonsecaea monophora TaxID=254056 RepID=A0A177FJY2_9EURO|nr:hypothetical protein AYO21_01104 [Fonsecaea monophora]OAG44614.1 hypothetical protein AYO21_01104 [Fonsecaea monophora]